MNRGLLFSFSIAVILMPHFGRELLRPVDSGWVKYPGKAAVALVLCAFVASCVALTRRRNKRAHEYLGWAPDDWRKKIFLLPAAVALVGLVLWVVGSEGAGLRNAFMGKAWQITPDLLDDLIRADIFSVVVKLGSWLLAIVVLYPIAEELAFRGLLFDEFKSLMSLNAARLAVTLLFAASHDVFSGGIAELPYRVWPYLVTGALFLSVVERHRSLWPAIMLHVAMNLTSAVVGLRFYFE